jgi:asparagine synthase (glutamine-hydrolysing)
LTVEQRSEQLAALIDDAVQLRLRSDVPVGAHLSGGLDSSAVTASAARAVGRGLVTFTGAFPSDPEGDERRFARSLAERYGLRAHEAEISIGGLSDAFDRILWHLDEPVAGPGVFPQLVVCDLTARQGVKVVLVGHGGDELFGGYLRHRLVHYRRMAASGGPVRRMRAARQLVLLALQNAARARRTATRVSDANLAPAFLASVDTGFRDHVRRSSLASGSASELMLWDLRAYLPSLLQVEDRVSMAASLESRTPLLDHRLVDAALAIPEEALFAPGEPKPALRSAVAAWLPPEIAARRDKRGFPTPLQQWKRSPGLRGLVKRLTAEIDDDEMSVFSREYLGRRERFSPSELWTVITIQGWLRMFSSANLGPREAGHAHARPSESHRSA